MEQWDDILRVVGSLQMGRVKGAEIITVLSGGRKGSPRRNPRQSSSQEEACATSIVVDRNRTSAPASKQQSVHLKQHRRGGFLHAITADNTARHRSQCSHLTGRSYGAHHLPRLWRHGR